jgi:8-oxo-dGTP pyrophosphatase MutT (NUDIX family)
MTGGHVKFIVNTQCAVIRDRSYLMIVRGDGVKHAPGVLAFPGGKAEVEDGPRDVLETTVRREVLEETGITVSAALEYVRSATFTMADGTAVVDVLFVGEYESGEPQITEPDEVAAIRWMTSEDILAHEKTPPWLRVSIDEVEAARLRQTPRHLR